MKLGISVLIIAAVVWIFWITGVIVKRTKEKKSKNPGKLQIEYIRRNNEFI